MPRSPISRRVGRSSARAAGTCPESDPGATAGRLQSALPSIPAVHTERELERQLRRNARCSTVYDRIKKDRQTLSVVDYPIEAAVKDAIYYHTQCSLVAGVQGLGTSVQLAKDPGLDAVSKALVKLNIANDIATRKSTNPLDLLGGAASDPAAVAAILG